jgi:type III secretion protein T
MNFARAPLARTSTMGEYLAHATDLINFGESAKTMMALLALCCTRMFVLAQVFPPMGEGAVQGGIRNGLVLTIGLFIAWGQPLRVVENLTTLQFALMVLKEGAMGLVLGFASSVVFWVAESVGGLVDNQAGFNNVQQSNPASGQESTPIGNVLAQLSHACFWILGGMVCLIDLLIASYRWWPLTRMAPDWSGLLQGFVATQVSTLMSQTITLAGPVMLVLLLVDLGFGLIAKTAEKLEPNALAQPVKGAVAMLMVSVLVALFFQAARPMLTLHHLQQELADWLKAANALPGAGT